jgi:CDP-paratose 2-epimerase
MRKRILITGGAGFVGSNLGLKLKNEHPNSEIIALDNLKRRGSELSIPRLKAADVIFVHGDIRNMEDIDLVGPFDILLECSAEPSVQAGYDSDPRYLVNTNLSGTINCLESTRRWHAGIVFLSTSRVYPIHALRSLPLAKENDRLIIPENQQGAGWSNNGITSDFPLDGSRSMYGATKLCSELIIQEYVTMYNLSAVINRCGVITGPWQMGKVDQGFVTLWAARHFYGGELAYMGFDGKGRQVRDILHVEDLFRLICLQLSALETYKGRVFNVGGGKSHSISLRELTQLCSRLTGKSIPIKTEAKTHPADIPYYVTDNSDVSRHTGWYPKMSPTNILEDIFVWLEDNATQLKELLA